MKIPHLLLMILMCLCFISKADHIYAQSIDKAVEQISTVGKLPGQLLKKGFTASGSISANSNLFQANILLPGQRPFESNVNGNLLFDFAGKIKMPFSFSWNTRSINYTHPFDKRYKLQQPFNRFQFKPTYKGFTLLVGVNTLSFSEYTLNSYRFEGLGFTFKSAKWPFYISFLNGILRRPITPDSALFVPNAKPSYRRTGLGFQVGMKAGKNKVEISYLQGKDRINSLPVNLDAFDIYPQKNVTIGLKGEMMLAKNIVLKTDVAISGIVQDIRTPLENSSSGSSFMGLNNPSANYYKAMKTSLQHDGQKIKTGIEYSYVDPQYRTMGIYYVADDLESISGNVATQFMEGKLSFMASLGKQHETGRSMQSQQMNQWVGSANVSYVPSEKFNGTFGYSNFTSFTNLRSELEYLTSVVPFSMLDTLDYRQVNQSFNGNMTFLLGQAEKKQNMLNVTFLQQMANSKTGSTNDGSQIANASVTYSHSNDTTGFNVSGGFNIARNDFLLLRDWLYGPAASLGKSFLDKTVTTSVTFSYLSTRRSDHQNSGVINTGFNATYTFKEKHQIGLNALFLNRKVKSTDDFNLDSWQLAASLNYRYNFDLFRLSKK